MPMALVASMAPSTCCVGKPAEAHAAIPAAQHQLWGPPASGPVASSSPTNCLALCKHCSCQVLDSRPHVTAFRHLRWQQACKKAPIWWGGWCHHGCSRTVAQQAAHKGHQSSQPPNSSRR